MLKQFIRFIGIGGINTIVTYGIYLLLLPLFDYSIAYTVTYLIGIGLAYWLNLTYVFKEKSSTKKIALYPLIYLVQYLFSMSILYVAIDLLTISEQLGPLLAIILSIPLTFILNKKILSTQSKV